MEYRKLANTGLEVSRICLGSWVFGGEGWGEVSDKESIRVVEEAVEGGINFIDTAPIYGYGRAEEIIGRAIKGKRKGLIIATKCGLKKVGRMIKPDLSASFVREEIENSLRRFGVDMIDLYQCHWPDPKTPLEETFAELKKLVAEGKVRHLGVSNFDRKLLENAVQIAPVVSNQVQYSLFDRKIEEDLLPFCGGRNIAVLTYGSLGGGILTGKYKEPPSFPKGDVRRFFYMYYDEPFWSRAKPFIANLKQTAEKKGVSVSQAAINWVLSHKEVASCIVGCRRADQLNENIKAAEWNLSEEELARIDRFPL